jgi:hypothetical protein
MARCCGGGSCSCNIEGGLNITVTGIGSLQDPFVIGTDLSFGALDTDSFNVTITGSGTVASPWLVQVDYAATATLNDIPDVDADAPTNGQVLSWNTATSTWQPANPTTAASGSVSHDTSLNGSGSVGSPLAVVPHAARYLATTASGVGITDTGINQMVRRFVDSTARAAASPAPVLNSLSMLDTVPGRVDYWNGSAWVPQEDDVDMDGAGQELLALSGSYANGSLLQIVRKFSGVTDTDGMLTIISSALLSGHAGILYANVEVLGVVGYTPILTPGTNYLAITARRLDDGALLTNQAIQGQVVASVY